MKPKERKTRRTKMMIRKDIFDAVNGVVKEEGFHRLTINQIAEIADMEPIVITRGFGSLENIIEQYVERFDYWLSYFEKEELTSLPRCKESYKTIIRELLDIVFYKKEIRQIIAWELIEDSRLTQSIAQRRDLSALHFIASYDESFNGSGLNIGLISSILISAVYYLSIGRNRSSLFGLDLSGKSGKKLLMEGIDSLIDLVFDRVGKTKEKEIAKKLSAQGLNIEAISEATGLTPEETVLAIAYEKDGRLSQEL